MEYFEKKKHPETFPVMSSLAEEQGLKQYVSPSSSMGFISKECCIYVSTYTQLYWSGIYLAVTGNPPYLILTSSVLKKHFIIES